MVFPVCASCFLHTNRPSYHAKGCAIQPPRGFLKRKERDAIMKVMYQLIAAFKYAWKRILLAALCFLLCLVVTARITDQTRPPEKIVAASLSDFIEPEQTEEPIVSNKQVEEAEYVARVMYGMARNHATQHQQTVVWCVLNRVDDSRFPDSIIEVCQQPSQWVGYDDSNPVLEDMYQTAYKMISSWRNGIHRPMDIGYVFAERTTDGIILRNTYEITARTRYYEA